MTADEVISADGNPATIFLLPSWSWYTTGYGVTYNSFIKTGFYNTPKLVTLYFEWILNTVIVNTHFPIIKLQQSLCSRDKVTYTHNTIYT